MLGLSKDIICSIAFPRIEGNLDKDKVDRAAGSDSAREIRSVTV